MNHEHDLSSARTSSEHATEPIFLFRKWVTLVGVCGTVVLSMFFFGFLMYQTLWGCSKPSNRLNTIAETHYAALVGTPMSAVTAFCIVSLLKVTSGPIEFEA